MADPITTIGKILERNVVTGEPHRDAIHIAIMPAYLADDRCYPGTPVKLAYGASDQVLCAEYNQDEKVAIGIVDPFLRELPWDKQPKKGDLVWIFLYPNTVQGMRHHWYHPVIDGPRPQPTNEHERWLREFSERWNFDYDEMIGVATNPGEPGYDEDLDMYFPREYICARGVDLHRAEELGEDYALFWQHLEGLTGRTYYQEHKDKVGWTCSC